VRPSILTDQSLNDPSKLVVVDCLLRNPCCSLLIKFRDNKYLNVPVTVYRSIGLPNTLVRLGGSLLGPKKRPF